MKTHDLDSLDIVHHMHGGMYAKETRMHAGMVLAQHRHTHDHMSILASGAVMLDLEGQQSVLRAPACVNIPAHKHHLIRALTDSVWFCIWPDQVDDDERIEAPADDMQARADALAERAL